MFDAVVVGEAHLFWADKSLGKWGGDDTGVGE